MIHTIPIRNRNLIVTTQLLRKLQVRTCYIIGINFSLLTFQHERITNYLSWNSQCVTYQINDQRTFERSAARPIFLVCTNNTILSS